MAKIRENLFEYLAVLDVPFRSLDRKNRKKFLRMCFLNSLVNMFDVFGLLLITLIITLTNSMIGNETKSNFLNQIIQKIIPLNSNSRTLLMLLITFAVIFFMLKTFISLITLRKTINFLTKQSVPISIEVMKTILRSSIVERQNIHSAQIEYSVTEGVNRVVIGILGSISMLISDALLFGVIGVVLFLYDPALTIASLLFLVLVGLVLHMYSTNEVYRIGNKKALSDIEMSKIVNILLINFRELYVRNLLDKSYINLEEQRRKNAQAIASLWFLPNVSKYVIEGSIVIGAALLGGIEYWRSGFSSSATSLIVFIVAGTRIAPSLIKIQQNFLLIKASRGQASETLRWMNESNVYQEKAADPQVAEKNNQVPTISFENVSFKYHPKQEGPTLEGITLNIWANTGFVLITGPSGSGKSTFVDLMLGLLEPLSGKISINGKKPKVFIDQSPGLISYLPQSSPLIAESLMSNIKFGIQNLQVNQERIIQCLDIVGMRNIIMDNREALDTNLGLLGSNISGGQRQRLALARALYPNPEILILDEVISGLDAASELEILEVLNTLSKNMLILLISHSSLATKYATTTLKLEKGKLRID